MIKFYNTLSRQKEGFKPIKDHQVGIYTCGPTVYDFPHIGNLRAYIFADILHRTLIYAGFQVKHIINITDVGHLTSDADTGEDRMEKAAAREHEPVETIIRRYTEAFFSDLKKLNINQEDYLFPRASQHVDEQIGLIKKLETKGFTYVTSDGVYFDTGRFPDYGQLAKLNLEGLKAGARVETNPEKKHPTDFALWKFSPTDCKRAQEWPSPWGVGFPGWHLECSAMSMKYLGEHFDIHTGGIDHLSVHHPNEIAQSEAATGDGQPFVNYWLHSGFLIVAGKKMAKREGQFITLSSLTEKGYSPASFRYFVLTAHYRKNLNFTWPALESAKNALAKLTDNFLAWGEGSGGAIDDQHQKRFKTAIFDDLNMPAVLAAVWETVDDQRLSPADKRATLIDFDRILGLGLNDLKPAKIPAEIKILAHKREAARQAENWPEADRLRGQIADAGFIVDDTPDGPILKPK